VSGSQSKPRHPQGFAAFSPLAKLAIWIGSVAVLAGLVQLLASALGLEFNVFLESGGGRGVLLGLALASLLVLMAIDGRPVADYGLAVGARWRRRLFGGFLAGATAYAGYYVLVVLPWAARLDGDSFSASRFAGACLAAVAAFPVALTQQIIFGGYLLSIIRQRHGKLAAVLVPAALFALLRRMDNPALLATPQGYPLIVGLFFIAVLLGVLRLKTGTIMLPAGVLAGAIFVRRLLRKTALVALDGSSDAAAWIAPGGEPIQSPLLWGLLVVVIGLCWWWMREQKLEPATAGRKGLDTGFKRVFPLSNSSMLAPLDLWIGRLVDARFQVGLKYVPRLITIAVFSSVNTILSLPERLLAPLVVRWHRVPDPLFIVGVHRSGTTHLHNMLALDPQFCTPRAYQILNPAGFFTCSWLIAPLLGAFLPWRRPMDSVRFHIFAPQEDEYVMAGVSRLSPYWQMTFPRRGAAYDRFIFPERLSPPERKAWRRHLLVFLGKLTFWSQRRPLLKNPYHTARVEMLKEIFPRARFIHIHRHPYDVYRSNMHTAREGHVVNQLQDPDESDSYQTRFLDNCRAMEDAFDRASRLPRAERAAEVRFEDLERDPLGEIRRVYAQMGLTFSPTFQERLQRYLESLAGYQKNRFRVLPEDQRARIDAAMGTYLELWGYTADGRAAEPERRKAA